MIIKKMRASFGKLHGELALHEGMNLLCLPNESGKSTWSAFLLAMLYGIDTAERAQVVLDSAALHDGDLEFVEHTVIAVVRDGAAVCRIDARAIAVMDVVSQWEVDRAIHRGVVRLR